MARWAQSTSEEIVMKVPALHHLVGYVAVLVLVGAGSAQALTGTGTVDSGDIKDGQVKRVDIAPSAVDGARVGDNTLTGKDIVESKLATVPNADKVDGLHAAKFTKTYTAVGATARTKVAAVGGLEVWAGCSEDGGDPIDHYADIVVRSTVAGATLTRSTVSGSSVQMSYFAGFDAGEEQVVASGGLNSGHVDLVYSTPSGKVVEANIAFAGLLDVGGSNKCFMHGTVFGG